MHSKLKVNPLSIGFISILIALVMIPWSMCTGVWSDIYYPLSDSLHTWFGDIILGFTNMTIMFYYLSFPKLLKRLTIDNILIFKNSSAEAFYYKNFKAHNTKKRQLFVFLISITLCFTMQYQWIFDGELGWTEQPEGSISLLGVYHLIYFILELIIIFNFLVNVRYTIKTFKGIEKGILNGDIKYNFVRLCQYNTGGLKPLGDIAMRIIVVLFTIGVYIAIMVFSLIQTALETSDLHLWIITEMSTLIIYVIITPTLFFMLLTPINRIMKLKKNELFELLAIKDKEVVSIEKNEMKKLFFNTSEFEKLKFNTELFSLINDLPTWPFNLKAIAKLTSMVILPIIPIIFQLLLEKLSK